MRIEGISPIIYRDQMTPVSKVNDNISTNNTSDHGVISAPEDFNAILKKCVSELGDSASQKPANSLADVLGYDDELVNDLLQTSDGKQKLAGMADNHLKGVVLSSGNHADETAATKDSTESLIDSLKESTGQKTAEQELQDTFESLASIYNRTIKKAYSEE